MPNTIFMRVPYQSNTNAFLVAEARVLEIAKKHGGTKDRRSSHTIIMLLPTHPATKAFCEEIEATMLVHSRQRADGLWDFDEPSTERPIEWIEVNDKAYDDWYDRNFGVAT